jgi:NitT/TauT family transport system substrate-binding protein
VSGRNDLRIIGAFNTSTIVFAVPKDSSVQTGADLKGQKVAIAVAGGVCHGFAAAMVRDGGLQPDRDVELIPGAPTGFVGLWTATKSGQFAATCLIPPISTQAVVRDGGRIIYDSGQKVTAWTESVIVTTSDVSPAKRDGLTRMLAVWRESADWIVNNTDEAGRIWAEAAGLEPDLGVATVGRVSKESWSPRINSASLANVEKQMTDLGQLKQAVDWQTLLDRSLLPSDLRGI